MLYDIVDRGVDSLHPKDLVDRVDIPFARGTYLSFMFEIRQFRWDHIDLVYFDNMQYDKDNAR